MHMKKASLTIQFDDLDAFLKGPQPQPNPNPKCPP
jgi:hypothetical protein